MLKRKFPSMKLEGRSFQVERLRIADLSVREICRITSDRVAELPEVDPNLMGPA